MEPVYLFNLASRHASWASARLATIGGNIANANTPAYKARDIESFSEVLDTTKLTLAATAPGHMALDGGDLRTAKNSKSDSWDITHSGNSVSVEQELMKAGEVNRAYTLDTSIVRSFHRMMMSSLKVSG